MRIIELAYDRSTRTLRPSDGLAGTTVDRNVTGFHVDRIEGAEMDLVYGVVIRTDRRVRGHPFSRLDADGNAVLNSDVLSACSGGTLPVSLRITYDDGAVESSKELILSVAVVPDPLTESKVATGDLVMTRNSSWEWSPLWTYPKGAVVTHGGSIWVSLSDGNRGEEPADGSQTWSKQSLDPATSGFLEGLRGNVQDQLDLKQGRTCSVRVTLTPYLWNGGRQRVENPAFRSEWTARCSWSADTYLEAWKANVQMEEMGAGYAVFACDSVPSCNIGVDILILETREE